MTPTAQFTVIDGGARYGLHPTWVRLADFAHLELFEADIDEADRLAEKYQDHENIRVWPRALWSADGSLTFNVTQHKGLVTAFRPDRDDLSRREYMTEDWSIDGTFTVDCVKLDDFCYRSTPRFMKLDVEGSERETLAGAAKLLTNSIVAVRSEVFFAPLLENVPDFCDIHRQLTGNGFELLNLDYRGKGAKRSNFTEEEAYGQLVSSDGVWVQPNDSLLSRPDWDEVVLPMVAFYLENGASDFAAALLQDAEKVHGYSLHQNYDNPLASWIRGEILTLLKKLSYSPHFDVRDLNKMCQHLLNEPYPHGHRYWQRSDVGAAPQGNWTRQRA